MCFTDGETKEPTNLISGSEHILEAMRPVKFDLDQFNHFADAAHVIKTRLSRPESTLISRTLFNQKYYKTSSDPNADATEKIYGSILYRPEESTMKCSWLKPILQDFNNYQIKKVYNMNVKEYMELNSYEKIMYDEFALEILKATQKEVERLEKQSDNNIKKTKAALDLDDFEEEL